ncbi:nucleoside-triphosphatase [Bacteroidota bacterium]
MKNILILTGSVKSGKTTRLKEWAKHQKNVLGVLQPLIEDERFVIDLSSSNHRKLEADNSTLPQNIVNVGKYKFNKYTLEWAKICLLASANKKPEWLIIDEYGKLELENKGLEPAISYIINDTDLRLYTSIVIVVRNSLYNSFLNKFKNHSGTIIDFKFK